MQDQHRPAASAALDAQLDVAQFDRLLLPRNRHNASLCSPLLDQA
jgi:hypothetical protein